MTVRAASRHRRAVRASKALASPPYDLVLYIGGATDNSRRALVNVRAVAERHLRGRYRLTVVDVYQDAETARREGVLAVPTLVRNLPLPARRLVGDLASKERVLIGLGLAPEKVR